MRVGYILNKIGFENIGQGFYTNRTKLFDKLDNLHPNCSLKMFSGVDGYDDKTFSYRNLTNVVKLSDVFLVTYVIGDNIVTYEIKKCEINK